MGCLDKASDNHPLAFQAPTLGRVTKIQQETRGHQQRPQGDHHGHRND
jgi:hypothetical protein